MSRVRITVVEHVVHTELQRQHLNRDQFPEAVGTCPRMQLGKTFIVEGVHPVKPDDFECWDAWIDLQRFLVAVQHGGSFPWMRQPGTAIVSCSDGMRPVSFRIERLDDDVP